MSARKPRVELKKPLQSQLEERRIDWSCFSTLPGFFSLFSWKRASEDSASQIWVYDLLSAEMSKAPSLLQSKVIWSLVHIPVSGLDRAMEWKHLHTSVGLFTTCIHSGSSDTSHIRKDSSRAIERSMSPLGENLRLRTGSLCPRSSWRILPDAESHNLMIQSRLAVATNGFSG
jgi:hypothetical protein